MALSLIGYTEDHTDCVSQRDARVPLRRPPRYGKLDPDLQTDIVDAVVQRHGRSVVASNGVHQREADAAARLAATRHPIKAIEHTLALLGRNPWPRVTDRQRN